MSFLRAIFQPDIRSEADVRRYALSVAAGAIGAAMCADILNQLIFFVDIGNCLRSWSVTIGISGGVAWPVTSAIGKAHLQLFRAKQEAERLGRTDAMTGLANRRAFTEAGIAAEPHIVALAIADIDRFKRVNDQFGHLAGDAVIQAIAAMMQSRLGDLGTLARVGGEEFALIGLSGSFPEIKEKLEGLRRDVETMAIEIEGATLRATVSIGIAARDGASFKELYAAADKALYVAKTGGRNRTVCHGEIAEPQRAA